MKYPDPKTEGVSNAFTTDFLLGDPVMWSSQAGGYHTSKHGDVAEIVPPRTRPRLMKHTSIRDHESYIVRVPGGTTPRGVQRKPKLYWPNRIHLKRDRGPKGGKGGV